MEPVMVTSNGSGFNFLNNSFRQNIWNPKFHYPHDAAHLSLMLTPIISPNVNTSSFMTLHIAVAQVSS